MPHSHQRHACCGAAQGDPCPLPPHHHPTPPTRPVEHVRSLCAPHAGACVHRRRAACAAQGAAAPQPHAARLLRPPHAQGGCQAGGGGALPLLCLFETRGTFCDLRTADGTQLRPPVAHVCPTPQGCCCVAHWAPPLAFATCRRGCTSALPSRLCSLRQLAQRALLAAPTRATPGHPRTHLLAVPAPTFPISTPPPPPV